MPFDFDEICIKAYDNRHSIPELNKLWDVVVVNRHSLKQSQLNYLNIMFNIYATDEINRELERIKKLEKNIDMQYNNKDFNPAIHERKKALTVKNPYAEWIAQGKKKIEVRSKNTSHRGELVICSSKTPEIDGMESGCTLAIVNLYKTKPLKELTKEEWDLTCIPEKERKDLDGYGWFLKDVVRIIEYPVKGQLGIWNLVLDKLEFIPYSDPTIKDIPVAIKKMPKFDKGAVVKGCFIISFIFAIAVALIIVIIKACINYFS